MNVKGSKHLDLQCRSFIEQGLNNNSFKSAMDKNLPFAKKSKNMPMKSNSPVKVFLPMVPVIAKISHPAALIHSAVTRILIVFLS